MHPLFPLYVYFFFPFLIHISDLIHFLLLYFSRSERTLDRGDMQSASLIALFSLSKIEPKDVYSTFAPFRADATLFESICIKSRSRRFERKVAASFEHKVDYLDQRLFTLTKVE